MRLLVAAIGVIPLTPLAARYFYVLGPEWIRGNGGEVAVFFSTVLSIICLLMVVVSVCQVLDTTTEIEE